VQGVADGPVRALAGCGCMLPFKNVLGPDAVLFEEAFLLFRSATEPVGFVG